MTNQHYAELARALLDVGDPPSSIARFLRVEYGLNCDQANRAIERGRSLVIEKPEMAPLRRYRNPVRPHTSS